MSLLGSVFQGFGRSERRGPQILNGKQSLELLKTVDDLLDESLKLVNGMKDDLSTRQLKIYRSKHNQLYLMVVDIKSDVREREEKPAFFSGTEERENFHSRVQLLHRYCQAYHTDVVSASRKIYAQTCLELERDSPEPSADLSASSISSGSLRTGLLSSMFDKDARAMCLSLIHNPPSGQPIYTMVSDTSTVTGESSSTQSSGNGTYCQVLSCLSETRVAVLFQPDYRPDEDNTEHSSKELFEFANKIMQCDRESLEEDCKVLDHFEGISWISSIFSSFNLGLRLPDVSSGMV